MKLETAFTMDTSSIKFGKGVTKEIGSDFKNMGVKRLMICTDTRVAKLYTMEIVEASLNDVGLEYEIYSGVSVEPTDISFKEAIDFAKKGNFDGYLGVGGGSSMDTVKAANLYATHPPKDFLDYVNPPIGKGIPVPGPVKPMICIPTQLLVSVHASPLQPWPACLLGRSRCAPNDSSYR